MTKDTEQIKAAWIGGDRVTAFTLYLIASYPDTFVRYVSAVPSFSTKLDALTTIAVFPALLRELVRSKKIPAQTPEIDSISNPCYASERATRIVSYGAHSGTHTFFRVAYFDPSDTRPSAPTEYVNCWLELPREKQDSNTVQLRVFGHEGRFTFVDGVCNQFLGHYRALIAGGTTSDRIEAVATK